MNKRQKNYYIIDKKWVVTPMVFVSLLGSVGASSVSAIAAESSQSETNSTSTTTYSNTSSSSTVASQTNESVAKGIHTEFSNKELALAVQKAEEAGLIVKKGKEQVFEDEKEAQAEMQKQINQLNEKVSAHTKLNQELDALLKKAKEAGVSITKVTTKVVDTEKEAQELVTKQVKVLEEIIKTMNEANDVIAQAFREARFSGTPIKDEGELLVKMEEAKNKADEIAKNIREVQTQNEEIRKRNDEAVKKYEEAKKALEEKNAQISKENEAIRQRNKAKKEAYDKALEEFKKDSKVETQIKAVTKSHEGGQYETFMKAEVNQKTGEFTLTHDMNDGARAIIGEGVLRGKINWKATPTGDGSLAIEACAVQLYDYVYTNKRPNSAFNKNIHFHIYDNGGKELFSVYHDGEKTFTKNIQKQVPYHDTMTLKPGEQSSLKQVMKVDDMWIYHTHGQIDVQFKNKNVAPKVPTYEQEKPLDPTKLTPPTPEPMKEAVTKKVVVKGEAENVQLLVMVCPVRLLNPKEPSITKKIVQGEKETDILSVKAGDEVTFKLRVQVPNPKKLTTLVIQDDLEDVLEAKKEVKVTLLDGTDITNEGKIIVDTQTEKISWSAKEPMKWREKQLLVYVKGTLKNVDLSKYVDGKGQIMIPNVAQLIIGDKSIDSNKVNITTPQEKPKVLPNTNLDLSNKNKYGLIALGTVGAIALGGTIVNVRRKGKQEQGE